MITYLKKIIEIKKYFSKKNFRNILELGVGKGQWKSILNKEKHLNRIISIDKIVFNKDVTFAGDLKENLFLYKLKKKIISDITIIISDLCNNISGIKYFDWYYFNLFFNKIYCHVPLFLVKKGNFVFKCFNKVNNNCFFFFLKIIFNKVLCIKLCNSKKKSSEFYYICKMYKFNELRRL
ncbi:SAM-dependent methyltransferase [Candidatus Vidania fulgoroideorum]